MFNSDVALSQQLDNFNLLLFLPPFLIYFLLYSTFDYNDPKGYATDTKVRLYIGHSHCLPFISIVLDSFFDLFLRFFESNSIVRQSNSKKLIKNQGHQHIKTASFQADNSLGNVLKSPPNFKSNPLSINIAIADTLATVKEHHANDFTSETQISSVLIKDITQLPSSQNSVIGYKVSES